MAKVIELLPEIQGQEMIFVQDLMDEMNDDQARSFVNAYRTRRKDPTLILITCLLGLVVVAGVHRILLNQIGMGLLYFFTAGLCFIGTIVDLVNYQSLAFEYNKQQARETASIISR